MGMFYGLCFGVLIGVTFILLPPLSVAIAVLLMIFKDKFEEIESKKGRLCPFKKRE